MTGTERWQKRISKEKTNSCVVLQNGRLQEAYYKNRKAAVRLHKNNSVTKSIISALVGLCLKQGLIPDLDTPIITFFPEIKVDDPCKEQITIDHLLTMTSGHDWPEFGGWHCFCHMYFARNWVRYVLERPLSAALASG
jgi:CubicO group peptidase (beta-lactamase class C family)